MKNMAKRLVLAVALLGLVVGATGQVRAGSITYQLVNYPAFQRGWTLSGFITTDGTLGAIGNDVSNHALSWTWTVTNPSQPSFTLTSADPNTDVVTIGLMATS